MVYKLEHYISKTWKFSCKGNFHVYGLIWKISTMQKLHLALKLQKLPPCKQSDPYFPEVFPHENKLKQMYMYL